MKTYKIKYELQYPDCNEDIRDCYILAEDFTDAQRKLEGRYKHEMQSARVISIEILPADIIV